MSAQYVVAGANLMSAASGLAATGCSACTKSESDLIDGRPTLLPLQIPAYASVHLAGRDEPLSVSWRVCTLEPNVERKEAVEQGGLPIEVQTCEVISVVLLLFVIEKSKP